MVLAMPWLTLPLSAQERPDEESLFGTPQSEATPGPAPAPEAPGDSSHPTAPEIPDAVSYTHLTLPTNREV